MFRDGSIRPRVTGPPRPKASSFPFEPPNNSAGSQTILIINNYKGILRIHIVFYPNQFWFEKCVFHAVQFFFRFCNINFLSQKRPLIWQQNMILRFYPLRYLYIYQNECLGTDRACTVLSANHAVPRNSRYNLPLTSWIKAKKRSCKIFVTENCAFFKDFQSYIQTNVFSGLVFLKMKES